MVIMKHCPKPPTYDAVLAAIGAATSAAVLAEVRAATAFFTGNQREALEAAIEERRRALHDGEDLGA